MGQVISIFDDRHREAQLLLPWRAAGTLEATDQVLVDAHLAECPTCQVDLAREVQLKAAVADEAPAAQNGWARLQARMGHIELEPEPVATPVPCLPKETPSRGSRRGWSRVGRTLSDPKRLRLVVGAQFAALLVMGTLTAMPVERPGAYRALGDAPAARTGDALVMFRPETSEAALRRALSVADARLVDGPTTAGAYLLQLPGGANGPGLIALRRNPDVTLAEPIGAGPSE